MNEIYKILISFILFICVCIGCFFSGYLLRNKRAIEQLNEANRKLAEQQQRYDELIKSTDERIRNIRTELSGKIFDNGEAAKELSGIIEQIRKQKLDIQI